MSDNRKISICIPTYNRYDFVIQSIASVLKDDRIDEIVINDDASTDDSYEKLKSYYVDHAKVKFFRNEVNLDCYANKKQTISLASNEWVILLDSDNVIDTTYIDKVFEFGEWDKKIILAPDFAMSEFDFTAYAGMTISRANVAANIGRQFFETMLNCMNYFVNRDEYIRVWDAEVNPHTSDSIYQNYRWLSHDNSIYVVSGMRYYHRMHDSSHYLLNNHKTGDFHTYVMTKILQLS